MSAKSPPRIRYNPEIVRDLVMTALEKAPEFAEFKQAFLDSPIHRRNIFDYFFPVSEIVGEVYELEYERAYVVDPHAELRQSVTDYFIFQDIAKVPMSWFYECNAYIQGLSKRDRHTLRRYTRHGDEIVNALLRDIPERHIVGGEEVLTQSDAFYMNTKVYKCLFKDMPANSSLLYAMQLIDTYDPGNEDFYITADGDIDSFALPALMLLDAQYFEGVNRTDPVAELNHVLPLIYQYIIELRVILQRAPILTEPLQVFRATDTDYLNNPYEDATVKGFLSTTLDAAFTENYAHNKYIYQITIQPGTPCLSMYSISFFTGEFEVLVDVNCYAMASDLMEKHNLFRDTRTPIVEPDHVLVAPQNHVRKVRAVQLVGNPGLPVIGGRAKSRTRKSAKTRRLYSAKRQSSKSRMKRQPSRHATVFTKKQSWTQRDFLPLRIQWSPAPHAVHRQLLAGLTLHDSRDDL